MVVLGSIRILQINIGFRLFPFTEKEGGYVLQSSLESMLADSMRGICSLGNAPENISC